MLIASKFQRPKAPVELGGITYFFTPIDPANADSEHVATVTDPDHIQRFLGIAEGYYVARANEYPTASKPAADPSSNPPPPPPDAPTGTGDQANGDPQTPPGANLTATLPPEMLEAAGALNALSWQKLKAELAKGGIDKAVIKAALNIELAKPEPDQRATTVKLLSQALEAA